MIQVWLTSGALLVVLAGLGWHVPFGSGRRQALGPERFALHLTVGVALGVVALHWLTPLLGLVGGALLLIASGLCGWWRLVHGLQRRRWRLERRRSLPLLIAMVVGAIPATLAVASSTVPFNFDGIFHSMLVHIIAEGGSIPTTWEPFEPVPLNYPLGIHLLMAVNQRFFAPLLPELFRAFCWWFAALQIPLAWVLAKRFLRHDWAALGAAIIFAVVPRWGAPANITLWGGLPTLVDMTFFGAFLLLMLRTRVRSDILAGGILLAAIIMTHHLTAFIIAMVLGVYLLTILYRPARPHQRDFLLLCLPVQLLLALPALMRYVQQSRRLGDTEAFSFTEEKVFTLMEYVQQSGTIFLLLVLVGIVWGLWRSQRLAHVHLLACWIGSIGVGYLLVGQIYPWYILQTSGQVMTAMTPSRWATMLACPLAIVAAMPLKHRHVWWLAVPIFVFLTWSEHRQPVEQALSPARIALYTALREHVPKNDFILNTITMSGFEIGWMAALSGRESYPTQLPASEPRNHPAIREKEEFLGNPDLERLRQWLARRGKIGYILAAQPPAGATPHPLLEPVWQQPSVVLYRLTPETEP